MAELSSQSTSVQTIYAMFTDNKIFVNRRYQRKLVWTLHEKQKLIESILKKYPVPAILLAEREKIPGTYEIIDGLQRLHAIISFVETAFPTLEGNFFDISLFPTAKRISDEGGFAATNSDKFLNAREVGDLLNYNLATSYMRGASEQEIDDVFDRINTYGHRLSDQERRQAGVQNEFSKMVRDIACTIRGDESLDVLPLRSMPSISIDLPMTRHGYEVRADEVFWVEHGILRATDLRDSMDEQCIADIAACIVGGRLIDRSKEALDLIYTDGNEEQIRIGTALTVYGSNRFRDEFTFCIDQILKACSHDKPIKLKNLIFRNGQSNAFPSVFAVILMSFHELIVGEGLVISDLAGLKDSLREIAERIERGRRATSVEERRKNIDSVKGLLRGAFIKAETAAVIYNNHSTADIDAAIRRSEIELADYELKQGMLKLEGAREIDENIIQKILRTICAIANNGPGRSGRIIIGVTDKDQDAARIKQLDGVDARAVGRRKVVGIQREAAILKLSSEEYLLKWTNAVRNSKLTESVRNSVLSSIDYNSYYGLGVIIVSIPPQRELCYLGDDVYWRNGDSTEKAETTQKIVSIARRF